MSRRPSSRSDEVPLEDALESLHRAAFELRETDPSEAVKVLRRIVKQGGQVEGLAHGALGEILLDVFDDVDGALHHYRRLVALAPALPAGHHGLARAFVRQGDAASARAAFLSARSGLEALLDDARRQVDPPPGIEEGVLMLYTLVDELRELGGEAPPVDGRFGDWAEAERLFDATTDDLGDGEEDDDVDEPGDADDLDDWLRYGMARVSEESRAHGPEAGLAAAGRLADLVPLDAAKAALLRSHAWEAAGRFAEAATSALESVGDVDGAFEYEEVARTAALLEQAGRGAEAKALLLRLSARLKREYEAAQGDEQRAVLESLLSFVDGAAAETGPRLVPIRLGGLGKR